MKTLIALVVALSLSGVASAASVEDDVNYYAKKFSADQSFDKEAVESLAWVGISDPRVFDQIEQQVIAKAEQGRIDRGVKNEVRLYLQALGFSGQDKYRPTLNRFAADSVYQRYAKNALEDLPDYKKWNAIISDRTAYNPAYSDEVNRVLLMLRSDDFELKKIGAKRIYFKNKDEVLLDTLAEQIRANYMIMGAPRNDAIAWLVKALGSAKQEKYRPVLEETMANSRDKKILKYARQALET
jgi:hypothetical protein